MSAMDQLREHVRTFVIGDEQSLLEYIPLAARLAVLGEPEHLPIWREKAAQLRDVFPSALLDRCREGEWDLREALGEDLGYSVIEAQDWRCFYDLERELLSTDLQRALACWLEEAQGTCLDDDAWGCVCTFLDSFDIPSDHRLDCLQHPMSDTAIAFLSRFVPEDRITQFEWEASGTRLEELAHFSDDTPAERLRREFDRLDTTVDVEGVGRVVISRRIGDDWQVVIDVELTDSRESPPRSGAGSTDKSSTDKNSTDKSDTNPAARGGEPTEVRAIQLGRLPGRPLRDDGTRWEIPLRPFEHMRRIQLMEEMLEIRWSNGCRLRLR